MCDPVTRVGGFSHQPYVAGVRKLGPSHCLVLKCHPLSQLPLNRGLYFWKSLQMVIYGNVWDSQEEKREGLPADGYSLFLNLHQAVSVPAALVCSCTLCKYIVLDGFPWCSHLPFKKHPNPTQPYHFGRYFTEQSLQLKYLRDFHSMIQKDQTQYWTEWGFLLLLINL